MGRPTTLLGKFAFHFIAVREKLESLHDKDATSSTRGISAAAMINVQAFRQDGVKHALPLTRLDKLILIFEFHAALWFHA